MRLRSLKRAGLVALVIAGNAGATPTAWDALWKDFHWELVHSDSKNAEDFVYRKYDKLHQWLLAEGPSPKEFSYNHPLVYHPIELAEVEKVTKAYGPLYLKEGTKGEKVLPRPWAGHWYPFREKAMFDGPNSPLGKIDLALREKGFQSEIRKTDEDLYASFPSDTWEGLCDAWAYASVMAKEPTHAAQLGGVVFSIANQRALATRVHQGVSATQYGILYRGTVETDGTYQDIRPEAFHQALVSVFKEGQRLILDDDAGVEVWSKPAFRYRFQVEQDPDRADALLVRTWLYIVAERKKETDEPTALDDTAVKIYDYRLYFSREDKNGDGFRIIAGEWVGDSLRNHPDAIFLPNKFEKPATRNPELNRYYGEVKNLLDLGSR